jgi:hypothetical protein
MISQLEKMNMIQGDHEKIQETETMVEPQK